MRKFLILILLILTSTFTIVKAVDTQIIYDFESINGYGYNLTSGKYEEKAYWSSTNKMLINPETTDMELSLTLTNFHHVLFWNDVNQYIGYINTSNVDIELSTFLGYSATTTVVIPDNAKMFVIQNYDYSTISGDIVYNTLYGIDTVAWEGLTYKDIFENNLVSISDLEGSPIDAWSTENNTGEYFNLIATTNTETRRRVANSDIMVLEDYIFSEHTYYVYFDYTTNHSLGYFDRIRFVVQGLNTNYAYGSDTINSNMFTLDSFSGAFSGYSYIDMEDTNYILGVEETLTLNINGVYLYDMTTIFNGYNIPSKLEFDTMLSYYNLYINVPYNITYDDIFSNSPVSISDLEGSPSDAWSTDNRTDEYFKLIATTNTETRRRVSFYSESLYILEDYIFSEHTYYVYFDYTTNHSLGYFDRIRFVVQGLNTNYVYGINTLSPTLFTLDSFSGAFSGYSYIDMEDYEYILGGNESLSLIIKGVYVVDLTNIFEVIEIDADTFKIIVEGLEPSTASYYTQDYNATHLDLISVSYYYDQIIHDYDAETGINTYLTNLNINDDISKVILGIAGMIIIAVVLGLATKNVPIVIMTEIVAYLTFTILGWFPIWIVILLSIILSLMGILKMTSKGGASND